MTAAPRPGQVAGPTQPTVPAGPPRPIRSTELTGLLERWLPAQRWFAAKGAGIPVVTLVGALALSDPDEPDDDGRLELHLVRAVSGGQAALYQVPLTVRRAPAPELEGALVGVLVGSPAGDAGTDRWVYDGLHDPALVRAYVALLAGAGTDPGPAGGQVRAWGAPNRTQPPPSGPSTVLRGEQSNTSVIVAADGPDPMMLKVFRVLAAGRNPDVVVQTALAAVGSDRVAAPIGAVTGSWPVDSERVDGERVEGHLAYACEFLPGSQDAWREACRSVEEHRSFVEQARALGAATAQVHTSLAEALPTLATTPYTLAALADGLLARVDWAVAAATVLQPVSQAARAAVDAVRHSIDAPALQQVHGDYHLGQVLHSPTRGWILLDFEGEPLRPLAERLRPDLALRDVAGMLRSFDYAARHSTADAPDDDPRVAAATQWAHACRNAFLDGYAGAGGDDPRARPQLLVALELDKALYEVVYETRNRPGWVPVPLGAVHRLLADRFPR